MKFSYFVEKYIYMKLTVLFFLILYADPWTQIDFLEGYPQQLETLLSYIGLTWQITSWPVPYQSPMLPIRASTY